MKQNSISNILRIAALLAAVLCLAVFGMASAESEVTGEPVEIVFAEDELPIDESAAEGYVYTMLGWESEISKPAGSMRKRGTARDRLEAEEQGIYDYMLILIGEVIAGERSSTEFLVPLTAAYSSGQLETYDGRTEAETTRDGILARWTQKYGSVIKALIADHPYELYWRGREYGYRPGGLTITEQQIGTKTKYTISGNFVAVITVSADYSATGEENTTDFNTTIPAKVTAAKTNADAIVAANAGKSDINKLFTFKEKVCELTDYNHPAADDDSTPYGDPWQLIYVFDGDPGTMVVCEGYSKAFQYLCEQSSLDVISVSGYMDGGAHMWNIVTIDDQHYLADITNSDSDSVGARGELFLAGTGTGTEGVSYTFTAGSKNRQISYTYDEDMTGRFKDKLKIASTDYIPGMPDLYEDQYNGELTWSGTAGEWTYKPLGGGDSITVSPQVARLLTRQNRTITLNSLPTGEADLAVLDTAEVENRFLIDYESGCQSDLSVDFSVAAATGSSTKVSVILNVPDLNLNLDDKRSPEQGVDMVQVGAGSVNINTPVNELIAGGSAETVSVQARKAVSSLTLAYSPDNSSEVNADSDIGTVHFYADDGTAGCKPFRGQFFVKGAIADGYCYGQRTVHIDHVGDVPVSNVKTTRFTKEAGTQADLVAFQGALRNGAVNQQDAPAGTMQLGYSAKQESSAVNWYLDITPKEGSDAAELEPTQIQINTTAYNTQFSANDIIWADDTTLTLTDISGTNAITLSDTAHNGIDLEKLQVNNSAVVINCCVDTVEIPLNDGSSITLGQNGEVYGGSLHREMFGYEFFGDRYFVGMDGSGNLYTNGKLHVLSWKNEDCMGAILPSDEIVKDQITDAWYASMDVDDATVNTAEKQAIATAMGIDPENVCAEGFEVSIKACLPNGSGGATSARVDELNAAVPLTVENIIGGAYVFWLHTEDGVTVATPMLNAPSNDWMIPLNVQHAGKYAVACVEGGPSNYDLDAAVSAPEAYVLTGAEGAGYPITLTVPEDADYTGKTVNWSLTVYPYDSQNEDDIVYSTSGASWPDALTFTIPEQVNGTAILTGRQRYTFTLTITVQGYNPYTPYIPISFTVFDKDSACGLTARLTEEDGTVPEPYLINKSYRLSVEGGENVTALYIWDGGSWQTAYGNKYNTTRTFTVPGRTETISVYATTDPISDGVDMASLNWSMSKTIQIIPEKIGDGELDGTPAVTLDVPNGTYTRGVTAVARVNAIETATDYRLTVWPMNNGEPDYSAMPALYENWQTDGTAGKTQEFSIQTAHMPAGEYCVSVSASAPGYNYKYAQDVTMTITGEVPAYVLDVPKTAVNGETVPIYAFAPDETFEVRVFRKDENGNLFENRRISNNGMYKYIEWEWEMTDPGSYKLSLCAGPDMTEIASAELTVTSNGQLGEVEIGEAEPYYLNGSDLNLYLIREPERNAEQYDVKINYSMYYNGMTTYTTYETQLKPEGNGGKIPLTIPRVYISRPGMYIMSVTSSAYGWGKGYSGFSFIVLDSEAMDGTGRLSLLDAEGKPTAVTDYMRWDTVYPKIDCAGATGVRFWNGQRWIKQVIENGVALPDAVELSGARDIALIAEVTTGEGEGARTLVSAIAIHVHEPALPAPAFTVTPDADPLTVERGGVITVTIGDDPEGEGNLGGPFTYYANILENKETNDEDWITVRRAEMDEATRRILIATDDLTNTAEGIYALEVCISNGQVADGKAIPLAFTVTQPQAEPDAFRALRNGSPVDTDTNPLMINETAEAVAYVPGAASLAVTVTSTGSSEETVFAAEGDIGVWAWTPEQQGTYALTLTARDAGGSDIANLPGAITVTVGTYGPLGKATITNPAAGAVCSAGTGLTVAFTEVPNAEDYLIILSYNQGDDENPLWQDVAEVPATGLSATISGDNLARFGSYKVSVRANAAGYESSLSEPAGFQVSGESNIGFEFANTDICTLIITGSGETGDFEAYTDTPWYQYATANGINYSEVSRIIVESGVTGLGNNALAGFGGTVRVDFTGTDRAMPAIDAGAFTGTTAIYRYYSEDTTWDVTERTDATWVYLPQYEETPGRLPITYGDPDGPGGEDVGWYVGLEDGNYPLSLLQADELTYIHRDLNFNMLPDISGNDAKLFTTGNTPWNANFSLIDSETACIYAITAAAGGDSLYRIDMNSPNLTLTVGSNGAEVNVSTVYMGSGTLNLTGDIEDLELTNSCEAEGCLAVTGTVARMNFYNGESGNLAYKGDFSITGTVTAGYEYGSGSLDIPNIGPYPLTDAVKTGITGITRGTADTEDEKKIVKNGALNLRSGDTSTQVNPAISDFMLQYNFTDNETSLQLVPKAADLWNPITVDLTQVEGFTEDRIYWGPDTNVSVGFWGRDARTITLSGGEDGTGINEFFTNSTVGTINLNCPAEKLEVSQAPGNGNALVLNINGEVKEDVRLSVRGGSNVITLGPDGALKGSENQCATTLGADRYFGPVSGACDL